MSQSNYNSQNIDHKDYETDQGEGDQPNVNPKPAAEKQGSPKSKQKRGIKNAKTLDAEVTLPSAQLEIISPSSSKFKLEAQADIAHPRNRKPKVRPLADDYLDDSISEIQREIGSKK